MRIHSNGINKLIEVSCFYCILAYIMMMMRMYVRIVGLGKICASNSMRIEAVKPHGHFLVSNHGTQIQVATPHMVLGVM